MSIEIIDETKIILHIHAKEKFKVIIISLLIIEIFSLGI